MLLGSLVPDDASFLHATGRLKIGSLEPGERDTFVAAQFNPKEVTITQPISWTEHKPTASQESDAMFLDFGGMQPQTVQLEMLFDGAEYGGYLSPDSDAKSVMDAINILKRLASVIEPYSSDEERRRPHFCIVTWGEADFPTFQGVIESLAVKYSMWASGGTVLRATATVSMKEASRVGLAEKKRPMNRVGR